MRVLVVESDRDTCDAVVEILEDAGHDVARCHEHGLPAFPCNSLIDGECPVHDGGGVDVAVTVRRHVHPAPMPLEDGVTCALRRHVPVVLVGIAALQPFGRFGIVTAARDEDVVDACARAVAVRTRAITEVATKVAIDACRAFKVDATGLVAHADLDGDSVVIDVILSSFRGRHDTAVQARMLAELATRLPELRVLAVRLHETAVDRPAR
jgi:hypothetical protein